MEKNNNGNKGVFPGTQIPQRGSIQTSPPVSVEQNTVETPNYESSEKTHISPEDTTTFISIETTEDGQVFGIIEIDLISFRERGQESRYLSINTTGASSDGTPSSTSININNENDFNKLKEFISKLNWND